MSISGNSSNACKATALLSVADLVLNMSMDLLAHLTCVVPALLRRIATQQP